MPNAASEIVGPCSDMPGPLGYLAKFCKDWFEKSVFGALKRARLQTLCISRTFADQLAVRASRGAAHYVHRAGHGRRGRGTPTQIPQRPVPAGTGRCGGLRGPRAKPTDESPHRGVCSNEWFWGDEAAAAASAKVGLPNLE